MAQDDLQDKTEKATPKKRSEARKKGQVAKSQDVSSVAVLLAGLSTLCLFGPYMFGRLDSLMEESFVRVKTPVLETGRFLGMVQDVVGQYIMMVIPVMVAVVVIALLVNVMQVGFMVSPQKLAPELSKISPIKGFGKLFSKQSFMELFKSLAKLAIVGGVAYWTIQGEMDNLHTLGKLEVSGICLYIFKVILKIFIRVCVIMVIVAAIDFAFQKWQFEEQLKMTKQEVKEEHKQSEGDPQVKSRIRRLQMDAAKKRMMQEVPRADVVVTNPVHLAVAVKYDSLVMNAPQVLAKGAELIAEKIKAVAGENDIPVVENKELAQSLYKNVEIGEEVPSDFYQAIAEVLAYVYRLKGKVS